MNTPSSKDREQHQQVQAVMMGNLNEEQVSNVNARALTHNVKHAQSEREKQKRQTDDLLLQSLYNYIEEMNDRLSNMEAGFEAEFGEAWREQIALRVLEPDEFPQQEPGESILEYRERLEKHLIEAMLAPDGSIKPEYLNNPELSKYAEWAQTRHHRDEAMQHAHTLENYPANSPQAQQVINTIEQQQNSELNTFIARNMNDHEEQKQAVLNVDKNLMDDAGQQRQHDFANNFANSLTPS